jgi:hypothetical protein
MTEFSKEITFVIYELSGGLSVLMMCTGVSYIIQAFRTTSHYRYDSADFVDDDEDAPGKPS